MRPIDRVRAREHRKAKQREQHAFDIRFNGVIAAILLGICLAVGLAWVSA